MRHVALALTVISLAAAAADAQEAKPAGLPQTVRLQLRNQDTVQGYLRGRSKDEVVIFTSDGRYRHVPLRDVQRFEVRSRTGSHARRGAVIGVARLDRRGRGRVARISRQMGRRLVAVGRHPRRQRGPGHAGRFPGPALWLAADRGLGPHEWHTSSGNPDHVPILTAPRPTLLSAGR